MSPSYAAFLVTILYPFIASMVAIIIPHIIHATHLLADPWAQESWQFEAMCAAIVVEHWFIPEAPVKVGVKPGHDPARPPVKAGVKAARPRNARPMPAFLVRRHTLTRDEVLHSMNLVMNAAHPQVIAAHAQELQAEAQVAQLRAAVEHASACAKSGYSSQQTRQLAKMAAAFKHIPERWREEIKETRRCWRNPQEVHARLEDVLTYM